MAKWQKYKTFNNWKEQNYYQLIKEYKIDKNCGDSMRSTDGISFDDFCMGKWQRIK